ncbi:MULTISPECIES: bifunctional diguanylate cyclase/phosphodiesterase [unclassified Pannonibacter]|uniref:putative bifunctional diguanylate cyclase/phosphodiesterase n=1 Tax=unclassified Pannonibacter TaxID=2627228 RepID=UPI0016481069|nr:MULTISPECIES: EAL domain-containing protein [unclassified Pannonibacter]
MSQAKAEKQVAFGAAEPGDAGRAAAGEDVCMNGELSIADFLRRPLHHLTDAVRFIFRGLLDEDELSGRIRAQQITAIVRFMPYITSWNVFSALIIINLNFGVTPLYLLLAWSVAMMFVIGRGVAVWRKSRKRAFTTASSRGIISATVQAGVLGILWCLALFMTFYYGSQDTLILSACLIAGLICAGGFVLATVPLAGLAWVVTIWCGSVFQIMQIGKGPMVELASLLSAYSFMVVVCILAVSRVFVARVITEQELEHRGQVIGLLLNEFEESASDWLWETDSAGSLKRTSARFCEVCGRAPEDLQGYGLIDALQTSAEQGDGWDEVREVMNACQPFRDMPVLTIVNGERRWWSLTGRPYFDRACKFTGYRGVGSDITDARRAHDLVKYLAEHDALTGVGNRNWLLGRAGESLENALADGSNVSLLMVDLDNFKAINDMRGHPVGDEILNLVAQRFSEICAGRADLARIGGDEFAILHVGQSRQNTEALANELINSLKAPLLTDSGSYTVGATIGIACAPRQADTIDDLMRCADIALYKAKRSGRGQALYFEAEMDREQRERREMEAALRRAVEKGGLTLAFQAIVSAQTGHIQSCEALLRWNDPFIGPVSPAVFVPIAEEAGLIVPIGEWVLREACKRAAGSKHEISIAVNLSPLQFAAAGLVDAVKWALEESGLPAQRLILEITESVLIQDAGSTAEILSQLKALGVRIALDDFGTGYSSLSYLRHYHFDKIKIDKSFVSELGDGGESMAIISAVIILARSLKMEVTAEGVETEEQANQLRLMGCGSLQGFYFGQPVETYPDTLVPRPDYGASRVGSRKIVTQ